MAAADRFLHRQNARPLLEGLRQKLEQFHLESDSLGIGNGVGSLIYGSLVLGSILEDPSWLDLSERLFSQITEERIQIETEPDLLYGLAGLLTAIGQLQRLRPDERKERLGGLCLQKLTENLHPSEGWKRPDGDSSLGFAHGAAGASYAAALASEVFQDNRARVLAQAGIDLDRRHYHPAEHNWASTANDIHPSAMRAWCSGLPGMLALSSISSLVQAQLGIGSACFPFLSKQIF